jgi:hypothetical protein
VQKVGVRYAMTELFRHFKSSTKPPRGGMLLLMVTRSDYFLIGHILLTIGIFGYASGNSALAYIGLVLSLLFFTRQLIVRIRENSSTVARTVNNEDKKDIPMQTTSDLCTIISKKEEGSL